jgi:phosphatidylserine decarboxylase precursor
MKGLKSTFWFLLGFYFKSLCLPVAKGQSLDPLSYELSLRRDMSAVVVTEDKSGEPQDTLTVPITGSLDDPLQYETGPHETLGVALWYDVEVMPVRIAQNGTGTEDGVSIVSSSPETPLLLRRSFFSPPNVMYELDDMANMTLRCESLPFLSPSELKCSLIMSVSGTTYTATLGAVRSTAGAVALQLDLATEDLDGSGAIPLPVHQLFYTLSLHRLSVNLFLEQELDMAIKENQIFFDESDSFSTMVWVFSAFFIYTTAILAGLWQTWLWVGCDCCITRGHDDACGWIVYWPGRPFILWPVFFFVIINVVAVLGGFIGVAMLTAAMVFFILSTGCLFISFHCKPFNTCCKTTIKYCLCCQSIQDYALDKYEFEELGDDAHGQHLDAMDAYHDGDAAASEFSADVHVHDVRTKKSPPRFLQYCPRHLGYGQKRWITCCSLLWIAFGTVLAVYSVTNQSIPRYAVYDRYNAEMVLEPMPENEAKMNAVAYSFDTMATKYKLEPVYREHSTNCQAWYTTDLSDCPECQKSEIYDKWILPYEVDMSIYAEQSFNYPTVNAWLGRSLAESVSVNQRPVADVENVQLISAPSDSRLVIFPNVAADVQYWVKGAGFTVKELIGVSSDDARLAQLEQGSMAIFRLSRQDYHHFHAPVDGLIEEQIYLPGTLHAGTRDAMTSDNLAILNQRVVVFLETPGGHTIAMVIIGSSCVGSIRMQFTPPYTIKRGEDMGHFEFGGSTVVLLFPQDSMAFDPDLLYISSHDAGEEVVMVEALVRMGQQVGQWDGADGAGGGS